MYIGTILTRKLALSTEKKWFDILQDIVSAYNYAKHEATKKSPKQVMF